MNDIIFFGFQINPSLLWIGIAVIFAVIEILTMGLATIWFSAGAVVAAISTMFDAPTWLQITLFFLVSLVLLYFTKPLTEKIKLGKVKTNSEALIGLEAIVTAPILPFETGQVKVNGQIWTAVCSKGESLELFEGTVVEILAIEGVKLIVTPLSSN